MTVLPPRSTHLILAAGLVLAAISLWIDQALFAAFKVGFILIAPGVALMQLSRLPLSLSEFCSLALVMGLALNAVVATAAVYAEFWSPSLIYSAIMGLTATLLIVDLRREAEANDDPRDQKPCPETDR